MADIAVKLAMKAGEGLIGRLVNTMYDKISEEVALLLGVREEIQYIVDELQIMSAFLREAEEKQASNEAARAWVQQVRQLSYAVEDCIVEFSLHLERRRGKNLKARRRIAAEIKSIKSRVQEVSNRRLRYGIVHDMNKSTEDHDVVQYDPRWAALFVEDAKLVGIDAPREKLVGWLMDETRSELSLIAVVGGGGLGKTTIVKKAYEHPTVLNRGHFTCRAWITVSQVYHVEGLLRDMMKQFNPSPPHDLDKFGRQQLITQLISYLNDKKYIIVFDDIWKIDAWKSLEMALPKNDQGSKVMLTTRNNEIAEACISDIPGHLYYHEKLSDQQSMDLFCKRIFNFPDNTCPEELKKVSQDLVQKCDGLPLAIVSIAGVLASRPKKTIQEWENLLGRIGSELEGNPNLEGVKKILILSYDDLPYQVKRCFLYLSKYPEDYLIYWKNVQSLWMAEGFVAGRRDMTAEEVAESYFNELVNRSMILPSTFSVDGKVKSFKVHDIMLELIVSKSFEENFVTILGKSSKCIPHDVIRRMSTHSSYNQENMRLSYVRSLSMFEDGITTISPSMRMLRVLDVDGRSAVIDNHFIENLGQLFHLKYLRLRNTLVEMLPKSLGNLQNLETLDLRGGSCFGIKIPSEVAKLQQLCVLRGDWLKVPRGITSLRNLQELAHVDWRRDKHVAREIGKLTQLRNLGIRSLPEESYNDLFKSLETLSNSLRSLKLRNLSPHGYAALYNLSAPPLLLESLWLSCDSNERIRLPEWVGQLTKVVSITLEVCDFADRDIRVLGSLPNLMKLRLNDSIFNGGRLSFGAGEFPCLKVLRLDDGFGSLRWLNFEQGTMPHLESIAFRGYQVEATDGPPLGIKNLPSLKEVNCYGLVRAFLPAVSAEAAEHPNHPRVVSFKTAMTLQTTAMTLQTTKF